MEEHNVMRSTKSGFCVYDSRGFDYDHMEENLEELSSWMIDGVHHNQLCLRPGDDALTEDDIQNITFGSSTKFVKRRVNYVMVVADMAEIYKASKAGDLKPLEAIRELFSCPVLRKSSKHSIVSNTLIMRNSVAVCTRARLLATYIGAYLTKRQSHCCGELQKISCIVRICQKLSSISTKAELFLRQFFNHHFSLHHRSVTPQLYCSSKSSTIYNNHDLFFNLFSIMTKLYKS